MTQSFLIQFVNTLTQILIWLVVIRVIMSWFRPQYTNPIARFVYSASEPLMRGARRLVPPTKMGIDFSPIIVCFGLELIRVGLIHLILQWSQ